MAKLQYQCPKCGPDGDLQDAPIRYHKSCNTCSITYHWAELTPATSSMAHPKHRKQMSQRQEKKTAKDIGGRVTPASGAGKWQKGDVRAVDLRVECKVTEKASYNLKRETLVKIGLEAHDDEIPVLALEFSNPDYMMGTTEFYVVPKDWFLELLKAYRERG